MPKIKITLFPGDMIIVIRVTKIASNLPKKLHI